MVPELAPALQEGVPDHELVRRVVEGFLRREYGTDRHPAHNERILASNAAHAQKGDEALHDPRTRAIDTMAVRLHDFVPDLMLSPAATARTVTKLDRPNAEAGRLRHLASAVFDVVQGHVQDREALTQAYMFTIDGAVWESAARGWRPGASGRVGELVAAQAFTRREGLILQAAINKTAALGGFEPAEVEEVLKTRGRELMGLRLRDISNASEHNIRGLSIIKAPEAEDGLRNPPSGNPAAIFRDAIEALSFYVPALWGLSYRQRGHSALGYQQQADDLRGAGLEYFYPDRNGYAELQHHLSREHFQDIVVPCLNLLKTDFSREPVVDTEARLKSAGSIRKKLHEPDYEGVAMVPDGVGLAFIMDDKMTYAELVQFARAYQARLAEDPQFEPGHPAGKEAFEEVRRSSGYEAVHMTGYYRPYAGNPDYIVPVEIQVLTEQQHQDKMYSRPSYLFYHQEGGPDYSEEAQRHLDYLARRGRAEREMAPGSTIRSIATMNILVPKLEAVFNELYSSIKSPYGAHVLVPKGLEAAVHQLDPEILGPADSLTVLPAVYVTEQQFMRALSLLDQDLVHDSKVAKALQLVKEAEAGATRDDEKTPVLEGHILPATLTALTLAIQSGKVIDSKEFSPTEYMSIVATVSLLHDYVEKHLQDVPKKAIVQEREKLLAYVEQEFGPTVRKGVAAMTVPLEIEDRFERHEQYTAQIESNEFALADKPPDRLQNHVSDLVLFASGKLEVASPEGQRKLAYLAKTDRHLSRLFAALPGPYARSHAIVWALAEQELGYQPEPDTDSAT